VLELRSSLSLALDTQQQAALALVKREREREMELQSRIVSLERDMESTLSLESELKSKLLRVFSLPLQFDLNILCRNAQTH